MRVIFIYVKREPAPPPPQSLNQSASMPTERNEQIVFPRKSSLNFHGGMIPWFPQSPSQPSCLNSDNYSVDFSGGAMRSDAASSFASEEGRSNYDSLSLNRDDGFEARSFHEPHSESQRSTAARELVSFSGIMLASNMIEYCNQTFKFYPSNCIQS
jgi:hypothetical protein